MKENSLERIKKRAYELHPILEDKLPLKKGVRKELTISLLKQGFPSDKVRTFIDNFFLSNRYKTNILLQTHRFTLNGDISELISQSEKEWLAVVSIKPLSCKVDSGKDLSEKQQELYDASLSITNSIKSRRSEKKRIRQRDKRKKNKQSIALG